MQPDGIHSRQRRFSAAILWIAIFILGYLSAWYISAGIGSLVGKDGFDLHRRWVDQQYFLRGQNPYDVMFRADAIASGAVPRVTTRNAAIDPAIGRPNGGGYPPWSFISGMLFTSLPWRMMRVAYTAWNLLAFAVIAFYAYRQCRAFSPAAGVFAIVASLAIAGNLPALAWGQYGIIVMALLAGAAMLEMDHPIVAGLLLGMSLLKPNISAPFCFCFLVQRRYKVLTGAAAYIAISSIIVWIVTKTNPVEMCGQMMTASQAVVGEVPGLLHAALLLHVSIGVAIPAVAIGICLAGVPILFYFRDRDLLIQYAIACVIARLWTYHRPTDNIMMMPLLLALAVWLFKSPRARVAAIFLCVGLSLWIPFTYHIKWLIVLIQFVIWVAGLMVLLRAGGITEFYSRRRSI